MMQRQVTFTQLDGIETAIRELGTRDITIELFTGQRFTGPAAFIGDTRMVSVSENTFVVLTDITAVTVPLIDGR